MVPPVPRACVLRRPLAPYCLTGEGRSRPRLCAGRSGGARSWADGAFRWRWVAAARPPRRPARPGGDACGRASKGSGKRSPLPRAKPGRARRRPLTLHQPAYRRRARLNPPRGTDPPRAKDDGHQAATDAEAAHARAVSDRRRSRLERAAARCASRSGRRCREVDSRARGRGGPEPGEDAPGAGARAYGSALRRSARQPCGDLGGRAWRRQARMRRQTRLARMGVPCDPLT